MHEMRCARFMINCEYCEKRINKDLYEEHLKNFHDPHFCECDETFEGLINLENHRKTDCMYKLKKCKFCSEKIKQVTKKVGVFFS